MHATHQNLSHGFRSGRSWNQAAWRTLALVLANGVAAAEPPLELTWEVEALGFERNIVCNAIL